MNIAPYEDEHFTEEQMKERKCAFGHFYDLLKEAKGNKKRIALITLKSKITALLTTLKQKCDSSGHNEAVFF